MADPSAGWELVEVVVPPGPLGILVSEDVKTGKAVVDSFAPSRVTGDKGPIEKHGKVTAGSLLAGLNEHDFDKLLLPFSKVRDLLIATSGIERRVRFRVRPEVSGQEAAFHANPRRFEELYTLGRTLGSGTFSVVKEAVHKQTGERYAIKCIKREGLTEEDMEGLVAEITILRQMHHPNIMTLYDVFTERDYYYLVTEFMAGGELFDRIVEKSFYSEKEARDLVKILLSAIKYCHDANVVHRDLKPENLLLTSKSDDANIKLADFGFAKTVEMKPDGQGGLSTACGTPGYVAPEILLSKPYGKQVDIWSIGVITYILLCGYPPFHDDNQAMLFRKIKSGKFQFDAPYWDNVSEDAKDLIKKMLILDPNERWTVGKLLEHKWIVGTDVANVQLTGALEELRKYNARRRLKAAMNTVSATIQLTKGLSLSSSSRGDGMNPPPAPAANATADGTLPPAPPANSHS
ncbi:TPA: hypothetical protein N0F65_008383 [Lagenidium giganteum]|uniref:non-specific serine/threonine protein kinase n=1 Tax=Lagenidium giganteum TaxID=4803 RepID=A0AAV2YZ58_9STRA|nr:TPA: hypothetical protein N0F65_008383 [Lagenidium giganteum]